MELTSKQRARLRGLANGIDTILRIGKDGLNENAVKQAEQALEARELIKCKVLENAPVTPREAAEELARTTRSEVVQVIGTKFVLYRETHSKPGEQRIRLERERKKQQDGMQRKGKPPAHDAKSMRGRGRLDGNGLS